MTSGDRLGLQQYLTGLACEHVWHEIYNYNKTSWVTLRTVTKIYCYLLVYSICVFHNFSGRKTKGDTNAK